MEHRRLRHERPATNTYRDFLMATVPNLIHYWPLDGEADALTDLVGSSDLSGGAAGTTATAPAVTGSTNSQRFVGNAGDELTTAVSIPAAVLLGIWFKTDTATLQNNGLIGRWASNNGVAIHGNNTTLRYHFGGIGFNGSTGLDTTSWHLVMYSSGAGGRRTYYDTSLDGSHADTSGHGTGSATAFEIGAYANNLSTVRFLGNLCHAFVANAQPGQTDELALAADLVAGP